MSFKKPCSRSETHVHTINSRVEKFITIIMKQKDHDKFAIEIERLIAKVLDMPLKTLLSEDYHDILYKIKDNINSQFLAFFKETWKGEDPYNVVKKWEAKINEVSVFFKPGHEVEGSYRNTVSEEDYIKLKHSAVEEAAVAYAGTKYSLGEIYTPRKCGN